MSIVAYREYLVKGGARPSQFKVMLNFPGGYFGTGIGGLNVKSGKDAAKAAQFLCEATTLPGQNIGVANMMYRGRAIKIAGEREFNDWTITVVNDGNFQIYNAFDEWMEKICSKENNAGTVDPTSYITDMEVQQLDYNDGILKTFKLKDVWPKSISDINVDFSSVNAIEKFTVTFALGWFETVKGNTVNASIGGLNLGF